jgi:ribonuclease Z
LFALTILGSNSAIPAYGRNPTAQVLQTDDQNFLIDCGEGTQMQLARHKVKRSRISRIFISHLHGDHYFGLIGLLTSMDLMNRTQALHIHAPAELENILQVQMRASGTTMRYPLHFHPLPGDGCIVDEQGIEVHCFPVQHRIPCWGFLFTEKKKPRKVIPARAGSYDIPPQFYEQLQWGKDYVTAKGTIVPNDEVTEAARPPRRYAYCADTLYDEALVEIVRGVDLLYHEATYLKNQEDKAALRYHSTTVQAAQIAQKAAVGQLVIGHFSAKYEHIEPFLEEASVIFPNTMLAIEGICIQIRQEKDT